MSDSESGGKTMEEEWDAAPSFVGVPLVAVLAGGLAMVVLAWVASMMLGHYPLLPLVGAGLALGLAIWLVELFTALRGMPILWKLVSLALLVGVGGAAGLSMHVRDQGSVRQDLGTVAEVEFGPENVMIFPAGTAARGPLSKLLAESAAAANAEQQALGGDMAKLGLAALNSPYMLQQNPAILANCGAIAGLKAKFARIRSDQRARFDRIAALAATLGQPEEITRAVGETMAPANSAERLDSILRLNGTVLDASQEQCTVLARRHWTNQWSGFGFSSRPDMAAYDAATGRKNQAVTELAASYRQARATAQAAQETIRDLLAAPASF